MREHPGRERLRGQLMLSLYRAGRQADALECYRIGRRAMIDELGIEPGRALQDLEAAILRHDAALDPPAQATSVASASAAPPRRQRIARRRCVVARARSRPGGTARPVARRPGCGLRWARGDVHGRWGGGHRQEPAGRRACARRPRARSAGRVGQVLGGRRGTGVLAVGAGPAFAVARPRQRRPSLARRHRGEPRCWR